MKIEGLSWEKDSTLHKVLKSTLSQCIAKLDLVSLELSEGAFPTPYSQQEGFSPSPHDQKGAWQPVLVFLWQG